MDELEMARNELDQAIKKFDEGNYLRGYRYEAIEQIYKSDLMSFEKDLLFSIEVYETYGN